ncbi:discoidin domain-containing protein [Actinoplanes sp. NPDC051633]|uniref:discoidin domain-containing protein n=1 Tax=Actinoplanes sp. NPDC051633 TaxID=3155670 RepID=UPI00342C23CF
MGHRRGRILACLLIAAVAGGLSIAEGAGAVSQGTPAEAGSYPFAARVDMGTLSGCSAVLVDPGWLLTAKSCFAGPDGSVAAGPPPQSATAIIGRADINGTGGHVTRIVEVIPHPDRDVALARLDTRAAGIAPVPLGAAPAVGETLRVAGYGRTDTTWVPDRLHTAVTEVREVAADTVADTLQAGAALCKGDAGGPALRETGGRIELVGLASRSEQGGCLGETSTGQGAVHARVDDLGGWIGRVAPALVPQSQMTVRSVDSEETAALNGRGTNVLDGNPATYWHTRYSGTVAPVPHEIQLDLGAARAVTDLYYQPRTDASPNGRIGRYEVYVSASGSSWGTPVATGTLPNTTATQHLRFLPKTGRYLRLRALSEVNGNAWTSIAELNVGYVTGVPGVTVRSADSEETAALNGRGANVLDGNPATLWHTRYSGGTIAPMPHEIQLDLGGSYPVTDLYYQPRTDTSPNGRIGRYEVYVSADGINWGATVASGTFTNSTALQVARFPATTGRYVRLRALSEVGGNQFTSVAELGAGIARGGLAPSLRVSSVDSEETAAMNGRGTNVLDGNPATLWHTRYSGTVAEMPHTIQLDLGAVHPVTELFYLPRTDASANGRIKDYEVYVSTDGVTWGAPVATGTFANTTTLQSARFPATFGRYVQLKARTEVNNNKFTSVAELTVGLEAPFTS